MQSQRRPPKQAAAAQEDTTPANVARSDALVEQEPPPARKRKREDEDRPASIDSYLEAARLLAARTHSVSLMAWSFFVTHFLRNEKNRVLLCERWKEQEKVDAPEVRRVINSLGDLAKVFNRKRGIGSSQSRQSRFLELAKTWATVLFCSSSPVRVARTPTGLGLVATRDVLLSTVNEALSHALGCKVKSMEAETIMKGAEFSLFVGDKDSRIVIGPIALLNHGCDSAVSFQEVNGNISVVHPDAEHRLSAAEELTIRYSGKCSPGKCSVFGAWCRCVACA